MNKKRIEHEFRWVCLLQPTTLAQTEKVWGAIEQALQEHPFLQQVFEDLLNEDELLDRTLHGIVLKELFDELDELFHGMDERGKSVLKHDRERR